MLKTLNVYAVRRLRYAHPMSSVKPPTHIASQVLAARLDAGLTREQLASRAGVTTATVYNLERYGRSTISTLEAISEALRTPIVIMPWAVEWRDDI
jgi:transcriptional regulator with XRE-family HTH domain